MLSTFFSKFHHCKFEPLEKFPLRYKALSGDMIDPFFSGALSISPIESISIFLKLIDSQIALNSALTPGSLNREAIVPKTLIPRH